jgi:type VI secretion system protein ImpF
MAKPTADRAIQLSLLDRLCARDAQSRSWSQSVRDFKQGVRRDIEWLLNTRRIADPAPEELTELNASLYHYGLPDISSMSGESAQVQRRLLRHIEETVTAFEPRMANVRASLVETGEGKDPRKLHIVIEGLLLTDPEPEQIAFDTLLEISSGHFDMSGDGHA